MSHRLVLISAAIIFTSVSLSCVTTSTPVTHQTGLQISGFVGKSPAVAAPNETVILLDGSSARPLNSVVTNFFGKYTFSQLPPGLYFVNVGKIKKEVYLQDRNVRLDIDLSAPGGTMDYMTHYTQEALKESQASGGFSGPNDPQLAQQIAGIWWGYSGSTERKIGLCPDGSYRDYTESGYSGQMYDSGGYQTGAWGSASQRGGTGNWSIQGDTQQGKISVKYQNGSQTTIQYRQSGKSGCLLFNGNTLCRTSSSCN